MAINRDPISQTVEGMLYPNRFGILLCALLLLFGSGWSDAKAGEIVAARYEAPTSRYAHGVLGDAIEYGALVITTGDGTATRAALPTEMVFEDVAPRLWDVTGDGEPEVVVVEAHNRLGARLAAWTEEGRIAATPHIGTAFRWLAPIAAADLDGDGKLEVAFVDRPHLAKTLRVFQFEEGRLKPVASLLGVSNHRIGWDYIEGGLRDCGDGPEMILASGDWQSVLAIRFNGALSAKRLASYSAQAVENALACR